MYSWQGINLVVASTVDQHSKLELHFPKFPLCDSRLRLATKKCVQSGRQKWSNCCDILKAAKSQVLLQLMYIATDLMALLVGPIGPLLLQLLLCTFPLQLMGFSSTAKGISSFCRPSLSLKGQIDTGSKWSLLVPVGFQIGLTFPQLISSSPLCQLSCLTASSGPPANAEHQHLYKVPQWCKV